MTAATTNATRRINDPSPVSGDIGALVSLATGLVAAQSTNLTHPVSRVAGMRLNVAFNLYGVRLDERSRQLRDAQMVALWFRADMKVLMRMRWGGTLAERERRTRAAGVGAAPVRLRGGLRRRRGAASAHRPARRLHGQRAGRARRLRPGAVLRGRLCGDDRVRRRDRLVGNVGVAAVQCASCSRTCNARTLLVCLVAVVSPCMASATTIGLACALGQHVNSMMLVVPFLILAVGGCSLVDMPLSAQASTTPFCSSARGSS